MPIRTTCLKCGASIKAPDHSAGKRGKCPQCDSKFEIPFSPPEVDFQKPSLEGESVERSTRKRRGFDSFDVAGNALTVGVFAVMNLVFLGLLAWANLPAAIAVCIPLVGAYAGFAFSLRTLFRRPGWLPVLQLVISIGIMISLPLVAWFMIFVAMLGDHASRTFNSVSGSIGTGKR